MKIRYIANFTDGTEWSRIATYNALNLNAIGYDVYCEDFKYNQNNILLEEEIDSLLSKDKNGVKFDYCLQQVLPNDYKYYGGVKNVGVIGLESRTISFTPWIKAFKMMDYMLVPDRYTSHALASIGINSRIFHYSFNYEAAASFEVSPIKEIEKSFNFFVGGNMGRLKNLESALIAFHSEFDKTESVNIILCFDKEIQAMSEYLNKFSELTRLGNRVHKEIILSSADDRNRIANFLANANVYIAPDYGNSCDYFAMNAMAKGSPVIYNSNIGIKEFCQQSGIEVSSIDEPCFGVTETIPFLFSSKDIWSRINILDLRSKMRQIYEIWKNNPSYYNQIRTNTVNEIRKFDYRINNLNGSFL